MNYLADPEAPAGDGSSFDESGPQKEKTAFLPASYVVGVNSIAYAGWILGTCAGTLFAGVLPNGFRAAMGIILYAMFIALLIPAAAKTLGVGELRCRRRLELAPFTVPAFRVGNGFGNHGRCGPGSYPVGQRGG